MTSQQIQCFLVAAASASFTEAAETLYMSQPTLGRHIAALEEEIGAPLFLRGWKTYELTEAGKIALDILGNIDNQIKELQIQVQNLTEGKCGHLRIGILEGQLVDRNLNQLLNDFRTEYPGIQITLHRYGYRSMIDAVTDGIWM